MPQRFGDETLHVDIGLQHFRFLFGHRHGVEEHEGKLSAVREAERLEECRRAAHLQAGEIEDQADELVPIAGLEAGAAVGGEVVGEVPVFFFDSARLSQKASHTAQQCASCAPRPVFGSKGTM